MALKNSIACKQTYRNQRGTHVALMMKQQKVNFLMKLLQQKIIQYYNSSDVQFRWRKKRNWEEIIQMEKDGSSLVQHEVGKGDIQGTLLWGLG